MSQLRYPALSPLWSREGSRTLLRVQSQVPLWDLVMLLPSKVTSCWWQSPWSSSLPACGTREGQGATAGRTVAPLLLAALLGESTGV